MEQFKVPQENNVFRKLKEKLHLKYDYELSNVKFDEDKFGNWKASIIRKEFGNKNFSN
jgi:hypothetical protein